MGDDGLGEDCDGASVLLMAGCNDFYAAFDEAASVGAIGTKTGHAPQIRVPQRTFGGVVGRIDAVVMHESDQSRADRQEGPPTTSGPALTGSTRSGSAGLPIWSAGSAPQSRKDSRSRKWPDVATSLCPTSQRNYAGWQCRQMRSPPKCSSCRSARRGGSQPGRTGDAGAGLKRAGYSGTVELTTTRTG